ncbi:MAG: PAS domain S-box protein [Methanoregula sp.]|nr:PAS domain S-box protein [Methanoregula sp.]
MISVLCVDDEEPHLALTKRYLEDNGDFTVDTAESGELALQKLKTANYDAVVSDYQIPGMDGIEFLKYVREHHGHIPFILFTGKGREEVVIQAFENGADFYLQKGGEPKSQYTELMHKIRSAVGRRQEKDALRESEQRYRMLVESNPDSVIILDLQGRIQFVNESVVRITQMREDEVLGRIFFDFPSPEESKLLMEKFEAVIKTKQPERYKGRLIIAGREFYHESVGVPILSDDGEVALVMIISHDITLQKKTEEALRQSEERYRAIFEHTGTAMVVIEEDTTIGFSNTGFWQLSGYTGEEIDGKKSWTEFVVKEDLERMLVQHRLRRETHEKALTHYEFRFLTRNGEVRTIFLTNSMISGTKKSIASLIDVTDRKLMESEIRSLNIVLEQRVKDRTEALMKANEGLEEEIAQRLDAEGKLRASYDEKVMLLKEVHHRVKNNLQIIASLLNLQSRYITDEPTLAAIKESQNRVRAMALVHEKLYRSEDISHISLNDYIRFLGTGLFQFYDAKSRGIRFSLDIRDVDVDINAAIPLGLIMNELISNSLKYAFPEERKGEVFISVKKEGHTLTILFKDDGIGIPGDLDWTNTPSLGLRLVTSLVDQMNGTIDLDRSSGTAFMMVLHEKEPSV